MLTHIAALHPHPELTDRDGRWPASRSGGTLTEGNSGNARAHRTLCGPCAIAGFNRRSGPHIQPRRPVGGHPARGTGPQRVENRGVSP